MELVITMGMLSLLTFLLFSAFELGTRVFRDTTVRQDTENQLRAIKLLLERDANHTNVWNCNENGLPRTVNVGGTDYNRDALAMSALDDWEAPANYDTLTYRPIWNRYIVWYATLESPTGALYRQVVDPPVPAGGFITPYAALGMNINEDPSLNADVVYSRPLSEDVIDFTTNVLFTDGTIQTSIRLKASGTSTRPGTMVRTEENLQVDFMFQPKNSWPQI